MIRYALVCSQEHEFDAWFRSSDDFEQQASRGLVTCVACGTTNVQRALMAPNVVTTRARASEVAQLDVTAPNVAPGGPDTQPMVSPSAADPEQKAMLEALSEIKRKITASADYVGDRFAEEARKIHYGEAEERGIYGQATSDEARALVEEGIDVYALPILPDERN